MGPSPSGLKAIIEISASTTYVWNRFRAGPIEPKLHIDLVDDTITDVGNRKKILNQYT